MEAFPQWYEEGKGPSCHIAFQKYQKCCIKLIHLYIYGTFLRPTAPLKPNQKKLNIVIKFFSIMAMVILSASVERFSVSRVRDLFARFAYLDVFKPYV